MLIQNAIGTGIPARLASDGAPVAVDNPAPTKIAVAPGPASGNPVTQKAQPEPSATQVQGAVDSINKAMKQVNSNLEFSIDHDTQKTVVKVVEAATGTVIKQFPSEEAIAISRAIDQAQKGLLVKQKA